MSRLRFLFSHRVTGIIARLVLGGVLVVASFHKIGDPVDFSKIIENYKVFPEQSINLLAIYMPWLEVFTGLSLIVGLGRRGGSLIAGLLMVTFVGLLSYNLARGCPTICGCFDTHAAGQALSDAAKFAKMRWEIALDVGLALLAAQIFLTSRRARP